MNQSHKRRLAKGVCAAALTALMLCSASAFAEPKFESLTFGPQSTHCDAKNDSHSIVLDGRGVSVFFNWMQAGVSKKARFPDRVRCDVTLKLTAPLEAPAVIQIDVRGDSRVKGNGTAATFTMLGRTEQLRFQWKDDAGIDRMTAKLPKGAQQLVFSIEAAAHAEPPDSTAVISIDSLDIVFERK